MGLLLAPQVVVPVLATACRVHARCLKVAEGVGADPYIPPRGRDRQRSNPSKSSLVSQRRTVDVEVGEPDAGGDSAKPGKRRVGSMKQFVRRFAGRLPCKPLTVETAGIEPASAVA
jgi:hypothetical protein